MRRSKVSQLPQEVKAWLDGALVTNNFSGYEALAAALKERGFDISKSAVHEYGQQFETRLAAVRLATQQAQAVVAATPDDEGAMNEALLRLVQEKMFQILMELSGEGAQKVNWPVVARAIADLSRASVSQKKLIGEVRQRARDTAEEVGRVAREGGLSENAVKEIRERILGVAG